MAIGINLLLALVAAVTCIASPQVSFPLLKYHENAYEQATCEIHMPVPNAALKNARCTKTE